jgi:hypothetical protein
VTPGALIATYFESRATALEGASPEAVDGARTLARELRASPEAAKVAKLWDAWGREDAWWPDWEVDEAISRAIRDGLDARMLLDLAVNWIDKVQSEAATDQVARWLKVQARLLEAEARRVTAEGGTLPLALTRDPVRLRECADRARASELADTCGRILAANRHVTELSPFNLRRLIEHIGEIEAFDPDEFLESLALESTKNPFVSERSRGAGAHEFGLGLLVVLVMAVPYAVGARLKGLVAGLARMLRR